MGWKEDAIARERNKEQKEKEIAEKKADTAWAKLLEPHQRKFKCYICGTPSSGPTWQTHYSDDDCGGYWNWNQPTGLSICWMCSQSKPHYRHYNEYMQHIRHLVCEKCSVQTGEYLQKTVCKNCAEHPPRLSSKQTDGYPSEGRTIFGWYEVSKIIKVLVSFGISLGIRVEIVNYLLQSEGTETVRLWNGGIIPRGQLLTIVAIVEAFIFVLFYYKIARLSDNESDEYNSLSYHFRAFCYSNWWAIGLVLVAMLVLLVAGAGIATTLDWQVASAMFIVASVVCFVYAQNDTWFT